MAVIHRPYHDRPVIANFQLTCERRIVTLAAC
jgi:hypothetical protein